MWGILAASLLFLSINRVLSLFLLALSLSMAFYHGVLTLPAAGFLLLTLIVALLLTRYRQQKWLAAGLELLLVLAAIALFLHLIPGFNNLKVLDKVEIGPLSAAFTLYYNLDKALIPFILLACLPSFVCRQKTSLHEPTRLDRSSCQYPGLIITGGRPRRSESGNAHPGMDWLLCHRQCVFCLSGRRSAFPWLFAATPESVSWQLPGPAAHRPAIRGRTHCWWPTINGVCRIGWGYLWPGLVVEWPPMGRRRIPFLFEFNAFIVLYLSHVCGSLILNDPTILNAIGIAGREQVSSSRVTGSRQ